MNYILKSSFHTIEEAEAFRQTLRRSGWYETVGVDLPVPPAGDPAQIFVVINKQAAQALSLNPDPVD